MKTQQFFQSLTQQLNLWRRHYKVLCRKKRPRGTVRKKGILGKMLPYLLKIADDSPQQRRRITLRTKEKSTKNPQGIDAVALNWVHEKRSCAVLAIAVVSFTGIMGHKLYNQPKLKVGTPAPQTMRAPYTASIEDRNKTETQRKAISNSSLPMLMVDSVITEEVDQKLQQILERHDEIRGTAGYFPFFNTSVLSISSQYYLRSCSDSEWQTLLVAVQNSSKQQSGFLSGKQSGSLRGKQPTSKYSPSFPSSTGSPIPDRQTQNIPQDAEPVDVSQKADFTQAVGQLVAYRVTTSAQNLSSLVTQLSQVRQAYAQASSKLSQLQTANPEGVYNDTVLLDLSDDEWAKTQTGIHQSADRILAQGIPEGLPPRILENAVNLQLQGSVPQNAEQLANKLLLSVLQPNLKKDEAQTRQKVLQAAAGVSPVMVEMRQGEVIVSKGKNITSWHFDALEYYQLIRRENNWLGLLKLAGVVTAAVGIFVLVERRTECQLRQRDRLLVLLLTLSTPVVLVMGVAYTTWSAIGLLLGSFYGPTLGVTSVGLLLLMLPMSLEVSKIALMAGAAGGILSSCIAQRLRSREELALLGIAIAFTQGSVYLIFQIVIGAAFGLNWYIVLREAGLFALSGLAWSIVALGLSPYLEKVFDLVTPIRLAELANPNRPLLKQLATKTPGTFQHTLFVSTLAEAAAKKLGCNVELVRAGTLYHDIGKMHDPLGFIENQMGGPNKHDTEINDPWKSAAIIKKHVSEGLVMARKHLLPTAIQAFIPEHQGTMVIAYFYHQAQQMAQANSSIILNEEDFRYDGPIPQSRETGIVMLADACEAALRSLKDASTEQALTMLNNILRARWQDNQLIDSGLTRDEMSQIAEIFVEVWQQFHHKRIAYPKSKANTAARNL